MSMGVVFLPLLFLLHLFLLFLLLSSDLRKLSTLLDPNKQKNCDPGLPCGEDLMHPFGESLALRNILETYMNHKKQRLWCYNFGLDARKLEKAQKVYVQLRDIMKR